MRTATITMTGLFAAALLLGPGCTRDTGSDGNADIRDIKRSADVYQGMTVSIEGEIDDLQNPNLFQVQNDRLFEDEIWVIAPDGTDLTEDADVRVTGTVKQFVVQEIERDYDFGVPDELEVDVENKVVLIAQTVEAIDD